MSADWRQSIERGDCDGREGKWTAFVATAAARGGRGSDQKEGAVTKREGE